MKNIVDALQLNAFVTKITVGCLPGKNTGQVIAVSIRERRDF
jgi:hypothetical protein